MAKLLYATILQLFLFPVLVLGQGKCERLFINELQLLSTPYVAAVKRETVANEGALISFRVIEWPSAGLEPRRNDPHGRISSSNIILGEEAGAFWGFKINHENQGEFLYTQGDVSFLNSRIDRFNSKVSSDQQIPFRFVEKGDHILNDADFVRLHSQGVVIIGEQGWIRMHDMNYHVVSSILIPKYFHEVSQAKSRIVMDFYRYLVENDLLKNDIAKTMESIFFSRASEIDLTGNVHVYLLDARLDQAKFVNSGIKNDLSLYVRSGVSPVEYLSNMIHKAATTKRVSTEMKKVLEDFLERPNLPAEYLARPNLPLLESNLAEMVYNRYIYVIYNSF